MQANDLTALDELAALERDDSPWYPTMRLFRQARADDWETVAGDVRDELRRAHWPSFRAAQTARNLTIVREPVTD